MSHMTHRVPLLLAVLGAAASAARAQNTRLSFEARLFGGEWTPGSLTARPGDDLEIRLRVSLINTTRTALGFAGITLQPTLSGLLGSAGDVLSDIGLVVPDPWPPGGGVYGRVYPFNTGAPMHASAPSGPPVWRLDPDNRLRATGAYNAPDGSTLNRGLGLAQQTRGLLGDSFNSESNPVLFVYRIRLGVHRPSADDGSVFLNADAPLNFINLQRGMWYTQPGGTGGPLNASVLESTIDPVRIVIVPSPWAGYLLVIVALRRPRRAIVPMETSL